MHYERTKEIYKQILDICKEPKSQMVISSALGYTSQRAHYHVMRLVDSRKLNLIVTEGVKTSERFKYVASNGIKLPVIKKPVQPIIVEEVKEEINLIEISKQKKAEELEREAKACYLHGSAMKNVSNLAEKLKDQSALLRKERNRSRTHVGISQVYHG